MSKHTPGPWSDETEDFSGSVVIDKTGMLVADCNIFADGRTDKENVANARLIAAAPDLLTALK